MNYNEWLRRQGNTAHGRRMIEKQLGKKKAALFLRGQLSIDKFTDEAGFTLNLEELEQFYPAAWRRTFGG
jgi:hypothetical protein